MVGIEPSWPFLGMGRANREFSAGAALPAETVLGPRAGRLGPRLQAPPGSRASSKLQWARGGGVPGNREGGEAPPLQALAVAGIWAAEGTDEVPEAILSIWCLAPPGPSFGDLGRLFLICERGALPFKC